MVDYTKATGSSGTMMIRDTGTNVEMWLNSNNGTTFNHELPWSFITNGVQSSNRYYDYSAGMGWARLGVFAISTSQTVTFKLGNTGTSGFGGPTTFSQYINRATVPGAPTPVTFTNVTSTSLTAMFSGLTSGGSPVLEWMIAYGTSPTTPTVFIASGGTSNIVSLTPGTTYYFWARGRNAIGWGPWSPRTQVTMLRVPDAPNPPVMSEITQVSAKATFAPNGDGGSPISSYQIGYGTSSSTPSTIALATSPVTITGLNPAVTYYFFVRAQNAIGWGPWSSPSLVGTPPGARVKDGAVYKNAIPYLKVAGVWRVVEPWSKTTGVWNKTI